MSYDTSHVMNNRSGLFLPPDMCDPSERTFLSAEEKAKRDRHLAMYAHKMYVVPLKAVFLRRMSDGSTKHVYMERPYYVRHCELLSAAFFAARVFTMWERADKNEDWPTIAGETGAKELTTPEWEKAYKDAVDPRWWGRVSYLYGKSETPRIPMVFTFITDSNYSTLNESPDEFVNIDNVYKKLEF